MKRMTTRKGRKMKRMRNRGMLVGGMDAAIASMLSAALMLAGCSNGNLNPAERADRSSRS